MKSLQSYLQIYYPQLLLLISTIACILVSIWSLNSGYTNIFQNLFYLPIIIACVLYSYRGFLFSSLLALIYFSLMIGYTHDPTTLLQAFIRMILFICIAYVITFITLSGKKYEEKYRLFTENSSDVIFLMDLTGKINYVSPSIFKLGGYTPEEILYKSFDRIICPDSIPVFTDRMKKVLEMAESGTDGPDELIEAELPKKDGTTVWVEASPQVLRDDVRKPIGFFAVCRNISDRKNAEKALYESETQFRRIIENLPFPLSIITSEGKIRYINPMGMQFYEFESDEIAYDTCIPWFWADPDQRKQWINQIESFGMISDFEMHLKTETGRECWMSEFGIFIRYMNEICILLTQLDITGRKLAEQAVRESEMQYRSLYENMLEGIAYCMMYYDKNGEPSDWIFLDVNNAFEKHTGLSDVKGRLVSEIFPGIHEQSNELLEIFNRVVVTGTPVTFETFSGSLGIWLRISVYKPKEEHFVAIIENITERKDDERAIHESEEKFISIFEETPDPIIIIGSDMQIIDVNLGFEKVFGYSNDEMEECILVDTTLNNLVSRIRFPEHEEMSCNVIKREEMTFVNQAGDPFIAEVKISPISIQGKPCLLIQIHDIDEIRKANDALAQANQKLHILSSITRHDILNRVMVTSLYSEMLLQDTSNPGMARRLEAINMSSEEIKGLIQFTGQYQEMGSTKPGWQQIEIILKTRIIQRLITGITLISNLGKIEIYADRMLEKVMYNLVENSVRHGKNLTRIEITFHQVGNDMVIWYEDDGGGIIQNEKEKVFQKGFGKNTGLGLFLIREILSITGITIVESGEPDIGVRFEIRVPSGKYRKV